MGAAKDLLIATVILAACIGLLVVAFSDKPGDTIEGPGPDNGARQPQPLAVNDTGGPRFPSPIDDGADDRSRVGIPGDGTSTIPEMPEPRPIDDPDPTPGDSGRGPIGPEGLVGPGDDTTQGRVPVPGPGDAVPGPGDAQPADPAPIDDPTPAIPAIPDPGPGDDVPAIPEDPTPTPGIPAATPGSYTVQEGDQLALISKEKYGTTQRWPDIAKANPGIDPNNLVIGQKLVIPALSDVITPDRHGTRVGGDTYIVKEGDNGYYWIAKKQLGDASRYPEIEALNDKASEDLRPGDRIKLPPRHADATIRTRVPDRGSRAIPAGAKTHTVAKYEILGEISQQHYGTSRKWRLIAEANGITDPGSLREGQKLIIPDPGTGGSGRATVRDRAAATVRTGAGQWHRVGDGQTLQTISQKFYNTTRKWPQLVAANPGIVPTKLKVGQKVWIPAAGSIDRAAPAPAPHHDRSRRGNRDEPDAFPDLPGSGGGSPRGFDSFGN